VSEGEGAADHPFAILIVCTANICRSPLAEHLFRMAFAASSHQAPAGFVASSAGTRGWAGAEMDPAAAAELRRLGGDPADFRARDLTVGSCEAADLILTATAEHRSYVLQECPRALKRTFTLLELAHLVSDVESVRRMAGDPAEVVRAASSARGASSLVDYDVGDPYGGPPEIHRAVADRINTAVEQIVAVLVRPRV
jgi:protein-tyrosine phosphatase